ncbi:hypothetical protein BDR03DRAFT_384917 [Suillus americanus]|nr:hypothetical protein BDR03DRAFT_384917 [Suillus americanus]
MLHEALSLCVSTVKLHAFPCARFYPFWVHPSWLLCVSALKLHTFPRSFTLYPFWVGTPFLASLHLCAEASCFPAMF